MIPRRTYAHVCSALDTQAAVALLGPRQVGKTTLACAVGKERNGLYLDLERQADREKLRDPSLFLEHFEDRLVILDEVHRVPELFAELRGLIDRGRQRGKRYGRFLVLGSASIDLMRQSSESLAGRIAYVDMAPLDALEVGAEAATQGQLWLRGGFPESFLAESCAVSMRWRLDFIRTYLERDVAMFGTRVPAETLGRLWTMLAHLQGGLFNQTSLGGALGISAQSVARYVDLLVDLLLLRRLPPLHANVGKRLVKAPKLYVRDSGLVHALLGIEDLNSLSGHPVVGASWEGLAIENLLNAVPPRTLATFYRTAAGAECDLVLDLPRGERWAIEIKRSLAPKLERGFHRAREDLQPVRCFLVYPGTERYPKPGIEAIGLRELASELAALDATPVAATRV